MKYAIKTIETYDIKDVVYYKSQHNNKIIVEDVNGKYTEEEIRQQMLDLSNGFIEANSGFSGE